MATTNVDFPYSFSPLVRTSTAERDDHIRDLIEQVLFTAPGERVMRPDFGAGLLALVFEPNSSALAAAVQMLVQGGLQLHLGDLIAVQAVEVSNDEGVLRVAINYTVLADQVSRTDSFVAPGGAP